MGYSERADIFFTIDDGVDDDDGDDGGNDGDDKLSPSKNGGDGASVGSGGNDEETALGGAGILCVQDLVAERCWLYASSSEW